MIPGLPDSLMSELSQTRKVSVTISYNGSDITSSIQPCLTSLIYKESFQQAIQADTLELDIADPEGLFRKSFHLDTNAAVDCTISIENWNGPFTGTKQKVLSQMFVQSIRIDKDKHTGTRIRLKCTSIPPQSPLRLEKKSANWQPSTLKDVATQVASQDGLQLQYLATSNPQVQAVTQHEHSDAYLLKKLCRDNDLSYKVVNKTIYIRDVGQVEQQSPIGTIYCDETENPGGWNNSGIKKWEYLETTEDIYGSSIASYTDPTTGATVNETVTDPDNFGAPKLIHHKYTYPDGTTVDRITIDGDTDPYAGETH